MKKEIISRMPVAFRGDLSEFKCSKCKSNICAVCTNASALHPNACLVFGNLVSSIVFAIAIIGLISRQIQLFFFHIKNEFVLHAIFCNYLMFLGFWRMRSGDDAASNFLQINNNNKIILIKLSSTCFFFIYTYIFCVLVLFIGEYLLSQFVWRYCGFTRTKKVKA